MAHDIVTMVCTAVAIFGAIRADLKFIKFRQTTLERLFHDHMTRYHKDAK